MRKLSNTEAELKKSVSLLAYVATFSGQLCFWRSYFFTLFRSNYFDMTVTFSEQLFLQNSCFFLPFQNSHFFASVIFSESLLFQSDRVATSLDVLYGSYFSEQVLFLEELKKSVAYKKKRVKRKRNSASAKYIYMWEREFKNEPGKICGRQPLKNFTWSILQYFVPCMCIFILKKTHYLENG